MKRKERGGGVNQAGLSTKLLLGILLQLGLWLQQQQQQQQQQLLYMYAPCLSVGVFSCVCSPPTVD